MSKALAILILCAFVSPALAMGSPPAKPAEPKYKLEITNLSVVPAQPRTLESTPTSGNKSKYKLEIIKMDVIPAPGSSDATAAPEPQ